MKYITGTYALNLPCSLETCGDWHHSALDWTDIPYFESENSIFSDYGIEDLEIEKLGKVKVANTLRAILDLLICGYYASAQGMKENFICNDKYTDELLNKVWQLRELPNWDEIEKLIGKEYLTEWLLFKESKVEKTYSNY